MDKSDSINKMALDLMRTQSKRQLVAEARQLGWRGDEARTPMLMLALFVATKRHDAPPQPEQGEGEQQGNGSGGEGGDAPEGEQDSGEGEQQEGEGEQQEGEGGEGEGEQGSGDAEGEGGEAEGEQGNEGEGGDAPEGEGEGKGEQGKAPEGEQGKGEQQQPEQQQPEQQQPVDNKAWKELLKRSGIEYPHPLLRKVYELMRRRVNVYLCGPAGCGKTHLAGQVAKLFALPFNFISCTAGMSESNLTGLLLPVGENGAFNYVPSAYVTRYTQGGVFLLDEIDASDSNTLLILNASLANGHLAVPQALENPIMTRHADSHVMAAGNTPLGGGADENYGGRNPLDGSTSDRFYQIIVDYDAAYEASLFPNGEGKRSKSWSPTAAAPDFAAAQAKFLSIRELVARHKMPRIVSTRFAQKLVAAMRAGVSLNEALADLTSHWSQDERVRVGVQ